MSQDALDRAVERTRAERHERRARRARACFRGHAGVYLIVNLGLIGAWAVDRLLTGEEDLWFLGSLVGWGIGLLAHWILARPAFHRPSAHLNKIGETLPSESALHPEGSGWSGDLDAMRQDLPPEGV